MNSYALFLYVLYIAYVLVGLFYAVSGILLAVRPHTIRDHIPRLFPLLGAINFKRELNILSLISVSLILFFVSSGLFAATLEAQIAAFLLSLWEVLLSFFFYWNRNEGYMTYLRLGLHSLLCIILIIGMIVF